MIVYHFHLDGHLDTEPHLAADDAAVRAEAIRTFGQIIESDSEAIKTGRFSLSVFQASRLVVELVATASPVNSDSGSERPV